MEKWEVFIYIIITGIIPNCTILNEYCTNLSKIKWDHIWVFFIIQFCTIITVLQYCNIVQYCITILYKNTILYNIKWILYNIV